MAHPDKPYRVYHGGRAKGNVPLKRRESAPGGRKTVRATDSSGGGKRHRFPRFGFGRRGWRRRILVVLVLLFALVTAWAVASYLALESGAQAAQKRLGKTAMRALSPTSGLLVNNATNFLVLGTDHSANAARSGIDHSDSILLLHIDPSRGRMAYLSIPRDLRVNIPGYGQDRINVAFQIGGAAKAISTISAYTGLPINHVLVVDFGEFKKLIDALGGVEINVPEKIYSNAFDCPYNAARCATWHGYRFAKGPQHMSGARALIYSRIRENRLDPSENDITRGARQQQVLEAVLNKIASPMTILDLPWLGGKLLRPLATDLSAADMLQLGWIEMRNSQTIHCRLGGDSINVGGADEIQPVEDNYSVIRMVTGEEPVRMLYTSASYPAECSTSSLLPGTAAP